MNRRLIAVALLGAVISPARGGDGHDSKAQADLQKQLNQQVMSSPFNAGDIKKAEAYAEEAKKANVQLVPRPPAYWGPGWTCANLTSYRYYYYNDYRNCVYYHRYYGHYWR